MGEPSTDYVGFWRRALAATIDNATWLIGFSWLFGDAISVVYEESPEAAGVIVFVYLSLWFNYFAFSEWRWGQTIGKNATGIMVASLEGAGKLSFGQASVRNLLRIVDFFVIGWIMVAASERKQRLGDRAARTVVVRRPPRPASMVTAAADSAPRRPPAAPPPPAPEFAGSPYVVPGAPVSHVALPEPEPSGPRGNLPAIPWGLGDTGKGMLIGLALAIFLPLLVLPFDPGLDSEGGLLAAQALLGASFILVAIGVATRWSFRPVAKGLHQLGLRGFAPSALGWMLLAMFAYYVAAALFASFVLQPEQEDIGGELGVGDETLVVAVLAVVMIAVLAPISEELFFRGFVFSGFRTRFSFWPAAVIAGVIFGAIHATTGITTVVPLAALGVALCWLYEKTGSLWPCVIAHMFNNGLALLILSEEGSLAPPFF